MTKNNAHDCIGDLCYNGTNLEIKASFGGKTHNKFNFVQIRMNHICEYVLTAYYLCQENVDVNGVKKHGKITRESLDEADNDKEYALRPMYGDACWKALLAYRVDEI